MIVSYGLLRYRENLLRHDENLLRYRIMENNQYTPEQLDDDDEIYLPDDMVIEDGQDYLEYLDYLVGTGQATDEQVYELMEYTGGIL